MQVQCPACHARFILPDGVQEGALLRCSRCKEVFPLTMPEEAAAEATTGEARPQPAMPKEDPLPKLEAQRKKRGGNLWLVLVLLFVAGFFVAWQTMPEFREQVESVRTQMVKQINQIRGTNTDEGRADSAGGDSQDAKASGDVLVLQDITQYFLDNNKVGKLLVIEGYVVNMDDRPYKNIHVEGALIKDGKNYDTRLQKAGVKLARTQLSVMTEAEINAALADEKAIVVTNGHVPPQGRVPFTMVYPLNNVTVDEYAVKVGAAEPVVPVAPVTPTDGKDAGSTADSASDSTSGSASGRGGAPELADPPVVPGDVLPGKNAPTEGDAEPKAAPDAAPARMDEAARS